MILVAQLALDLAINTSWFVLFYLNSALNHFVYLNSSHPDLVEHGVPVWCTWKYMMIMSNGLQMELHH